MTLLSEPERTHAALARLHAAAPQMHALLRSICEPQFGSPWGTMQALERWRFETRALLAQIGVQEPSR